MKILIKRTIKITDWGGHGFAEHFQAYHAKEVIFECTETDKDNKPLDGWWLEFRTSIEIDYFVITIPCVNYLKEKFLKTFQAHLNDRSNRKLWKSFEDHAEDVYVALFQSEDNKIQKFKSSFNEGAVIGFFRRYNHDKKLKIPEKFMTMVANKLTDGSALASTCKSANRIAQKKFNKEFDRNPEEHGKIVKRIGGG